MGTTPEHQPQVFNDRADIGTLGTVHLKVYLITSERQQLDGVDGDATTFYLDLDTLTRQFIQRLTVVFERRKHRRHLLDLTAEMALQQGFDLLDAIALDRLGFNHLAIGVTGIGTDPELRSGQIAFISFEEELREFGRLTQADRQHTGC